ncbi:MAG: M56 family metallopeptidase [Solirubrobacteraceae bacterium]
MPASAERSLARAPARWLYGLTITVAGLGLVATVGVLVSAYGSIRVGPTAGHAVVLLGLRLTYPRINIGGAVVLLLACAGVVVVLRAWAAAVRLIRTQRRFIGGLSVRSSLPGQGAVVVFDDDRPQAFCAGYLRPRVYVSTGTVDALLPAELQAVIAHENEHREHRDPVRIASARVLGHALFFLPALRRLVERYAELAELRADVAAVRASYGDRAPLASALLAFGLTTHPGLGIAPDRIDHLLGQQVASRTPHAWVLFAAITLALVGAATIVIGQSASTGLTLNLPILSHQPCILVLAALPVVAGGSALARVHAERRRAAPLA